MDTSSSSSSSSSPQNDGDTEGQEQQCVMIPFHGELAGRLIRILHAASCSYHSTRLNVRKGPWEQALHRVCTQEPGIFNVKGIRLVHDMMRPLVRDELEYDKLPVVVRNIAGTVVAFACNMIDTEESTVGRDIVANTAEAFIDYGDDNETVAVEMEVLSEVIVSLYRMDVLMDEPLTPSNSIAFRASALWGVKDYIHTDVTDPTDDLEDWHMEYKELIKNLFKPHIREQQSKASKRKAKRGRRPAKKKEEKKGVVKRRWIKKPPACMIAVCATKLEEDIDMEEDKSVAYDTVSHEYQLLSLTTREEQKTFRLLEPAKRSYLRSQFACSNFPAFAVASGQPTDV